MNKRQKTFSLIMRAIMYAFVLFTFSLLIWIIGSVALQGIPMLKTEMFSKEFTTKNLSMLPSIINTLTVIALTLIISVPVGVFTAIYLVEYAPRGSLFVKIVRMATETLQGIPSIVFGLFGYIFFVRVVGLGYSILSGTFTLTIMVLPLIIRATEEALIAVDDKLRQASYGLGARKLRTVFNVILPPAMNGIVSGIILAIGRIFGETAALQFTAGTYEQIAAPTQQGSTLAVFMYNLTAEGRHTHEAYASAFVLLIFVILINWIASRMGSKIGGING